MTKTCEPRHGHLCLRIGDFFLHVNEDGTYVNRRFLAVEKPSEITRPDMFDGMSAVELGTGSCFQVSMTPLKVFQEVSFEPTGKDIMIGDACYGDVLVVGDDIVIFSHDGFYSLDGHRVNDFHPHANRSRVPVMRIVLGNAS